MKRKNKNDNPQADLPVNPSGDQNDNPETDLPENPSALDPKDDKKDKKSGSSKFQIKNLVRAGQSVYGITPGKPAVFDEDGIAVVSKAEYEHFLKVPGYKKV